MSCLLTPQAVGSGSPVYLTEGWEVYPDRLLSPEDFLSSVDEKSHITIRIGDYPNFTGFHEGHSPHGLATYRLRLASRQDMGGLVVYLPEVFSACRVFINGREAAAQGSLQPYSPWCAILPSRFLTRLKWKSLSRPPITAITTAELHIPRAGDRSGNTPAERCPNGLLRSSLLFLPVRRLLSAAVCWEAGSSPAGRFITGSASWR